MPVQPVVAWILPLEGHHFDLEDLPIYLQGSPITVVLREEKYFLHLSKDVVGEGFENVTPVAEEYLAILNGLTATKLHGVRAVSLASGGYYGIDATGRVVSTVVAVNGAESRCKGGHVTLVVGGVKLPDSRVGALTPLLCSARSSSAVTNVLRILGRPKPSWSELYLAFEIVESAALDRMYEKGWITRADATLFSRTANSYAVLGIAGRHGKGGPEPPTSPMTYSEALTKIRGLAAGWIDTEFEVGA